MANVYIKTAIENVQLTVLNGHRDRFTGDNPPACEEQDGKKLAFERCERNAGTF
jgi:hypothetical protein